MFFRFFSQADHFFVHFIPGLEIDLICDINAARLGKGLDPRGYIDAVSEYVIISMDDIPHMDAYADPDPFFRRKQGVFSLDFFLNVDGTPESLDST
jgi:hypothetical protein